MKTKDLTDKQIQEQINALEEENRNTQRLSMGRGHGWGDDAMERRRNKILHLKSILFARRVEKIKPTPKKKTTKDPFKELTGMTKKKYAKQKKRQLRERIIILHEFSKGKDEGVIAEDFSIPHEQVNKEIADYVRFLMPRFGAKTGDDVMKSMAKYVAPFIEEGKAHPPKKEGLTRTWNSKTKQWVYHYTKRAKNAKKQPDTKLSKHDKLLLAGKYKIRGKPKDARKLGKAVTKGLRKTNKTTNAKVKTKRKMRIPKDYKVQEVLGVFDMYFRHEYIGTRPTREAAIEYIGVHKNSQTKPKPKKKKRVKAKSQQKTLFRG